MNVCIYIFIYITIIMCMYSKEYIAWHTLYLYIYIDIPLVDLYLRFNLLLINR